ncbi:uncharacterized protein [Nicotiana tomentosiformis]|uniref:uncharacterized protein n=1 Tax=Nicotiana tomentosiformis TaxID=4098 RepID=UPI00051C8473|nr:uncharacterized protein LOC117276757 [Nicotiana tomentosiformis]
MHPCSFSSTVSHAERLELWNKQKKADWNMNKKARTTYGYGGSSGGSSSRGPSGPTQSMVPSVGNAPSRRQGQGHGDNSRPTKSATPQRERGSPLVQQGGSTATTAAPPPVDSTTTQTGRIAGSSAASTSSGQPRLYGLVPRADAEAANAFMTCILNVCALDAYVLIDPGSTFSYVTPYFALDFGIDPEQFLEHFSLSTLVGDSVIASRVYKGCRIAVLDR